LATPSDADSVTAPGTSAVCAGPGESLTGV